MYEYHVLSMYIMFYVWISCFVSYHLLVCQALLKSKMDRPDQDPKPRCLFKLCIWLQRIRRGWKNFFVSSKDRTSQSWFFLKKKIQQKLLFSHRTDFITCFRSRLLNTKYITLVINRLCFKNKSTEYFYLLRTFISAFPCGLVMLLCKDDYILNMANMISWIKCVKYALLYVQSWPIQASQTYIN